MLAAQQSRVSKQGSIFRQTPLNESMILEVTNQGTQIVNETLGHSLEASGMDFLDLESQ